MRQFTKPSPFKIFLFVAIPTLLVGGHAHAGIGNIWALDDGTKIKALDLNHRLKAKNGIYDGKKIRLFAAKNEIIAFQLILEGGAKRTNNIRVKLDEVGSIRNGKLSADPNRYFIDRRIELFKEHYFNITERSHDLSWKKNSDAQPAGFTGLLPDALVPLAEKEFFEVLPRRNQAIWIDIYVPKDTAPGIHRGKIVIEVDGSPCKSANCTLPVELEVLDKTLPDKPHTKTMLWFSGGDNDRDQMAARYFSKPWEATKSQAEKLRHRHFKQVWRHRISLFLGDVNAPHAALKDRLQGTAYSKAAGYDGPGLNVPQDFYSIHTMGGKVSPSQAKMWTQWFKKQAPKAKYFLYTVDEPSLSQLAEVNKRAAQAAPVPSFVTSQYDARVKVDIFSVIAEEFSLKKRAAAKKAGKEYWIYNGVRPFSGSFATDDVAISTRVNPWIQYKYKIDRWFYWESTYYNDFQGGRKHINVFRDPINFSNRHGDKMNGDGLLLYPGRDKVFPKEDRNSDNPLPSIRLKNWRRGVQDVEYLRLAEAAGHGAFIKKLIQKMVPRALADETKAGESVSWPEDGEKWLEARRLIFNLLAGKKAAALPVPPKLEKLGRKEESGTKKILGKAKRAKEKIFSRKRYWVPLVLLPVFAVAGFYLLRKRKNRGGE